ncbi:MAG: helix-turn-helix domain-containing protein [Paracoccaceae bacterium]
MPDETLPRSIYEAETQEEDLWFLPGDPVDSDPTAIPLPRLDTVRVPGAAIWQAAENAQVRGLAQAAAETARLDEAVKAWASVPGGDGISHRLALLDVAGLSWAEGQRLPVERLALYGVLRLSASDADHRDLALADWARERLLGSRDPFAPEAFLGRVRVEEDGLGEIDAIGGMGRRPVGEEFRALSQRWLDMVQRADLHPITRAAFAYHLWRGLGLSGFEGVIEPSIIAAKMASTDQVHLPFLPLALSGVQGLMASGVPPRKLELWYDGIANAARVARLELDRLAAWHRRATDSIADLSGKTPRALIAALIATPVLSAQSAEAHTGASRAAVQRNLALFTERGLVREITGQERYRIWGVVV